MADRELVLREKLEQTGVFDFKGLYSYAHFWFREERFDGVDEDRYVERVEGNKRNIRFEWTATRRFSDYFKEEIKLEFSISGMTDVEVEIDGVRKKMNKAKVEIVIRAALIKDPESKWETSPTSRFMRDVYNKYVIPSRIDNMRKLVVRDAQKLKDDFKEFMDLSGRRYLIT